MYKKKIKKYLTGTQRLNNQPDYTDLQNKRATDAGQGQLVTDAVSSVFPVVGGFMKMGRPVTNITQDEKGLNKGNNALSKRTNSVINGHVNMDTQSGNLIRTLKKSFSGDATWEGNLDQFTGGLFGKSYMETEREELVKKAQQKATNQNFNNNFDQGSTTDSMSFAKKGKYKVKPRVIETEGREPVFSPKKADGSRDLLYYNPQGKTHAEGGEKMAVVPRNKIKYQKGTNSLEEDPILKGAKFPYRIANKSRRDLQIKNLYLDFLDRDRTAGDHFFKQFHNNYGSDRINRPLENYYGFDRADISDDSLKVWRSQHKKELKYKCGTSKIKYGDGSKKLKYKSSITDDRDKTPIEKLNTKTPILNNNNTPPPERVVKPVIDKLSIRQSNINVPEINKNINLKKTPEFIGPSQEINIDPREKEGIEFLKGKTPTLKIENKINKPILKKIPVAKSTNPIIKKPINTREATFFTYGFYDHNNNGKNDFEEEVNRSSKKMKQFYGKMNTVNIDNRDPQRNVKLINALKKVKNNSDLYLLDHAGSNLYGMSHDQLAATVAANTKHLKGGKNNFYLGSCFGGGGGNGYDDGQFVKKLNSQTKGKTFKNLYSTNHQLWQGTDPSDKHKTPEDVFLPNKADRLVVKNKMGNKAVKYKKGTKSIQGAIPEGSSIVTAEGGMNKKALLAYKNKDWKTLDKIINSMPEDKSNKKELGDEEIKAYPAPRFTPYTDPTEDKRKGEYKSTTKKRKYIQKNIGNPKSKLKGASLDKEGNIVYENPIIKSKMEIAAKNNYNDIKPITPKTPSLSQPSKTPVLNKVNVNTTPYTGSDLKTINSDGSDKKSRNINASNIPSLFELGAKVGVLSQGIEKVPENYLSLKKYKYASQLPLILRENNEDFNNSKNTIRNSVGGNTGSYLSNISNLYSNKLKANNAAVVTDTLARQDILNKNVDIDNTEAQVNRSLKDQYADINARRRGAYQNMLISAGQSADEAVNTYNANKAQDNYNQQYLNVLKDMYPNYTLDENGNKIFKQRKGAKNLKYRRK